MYQATLKTISEHNPPLSVSHSWRPLRILNYYRLALSWIFIALLLILEPSAGGIGYANTLVYYVTSMFYLFFGAVCAYTINIKKPVFAIQTNLQVFVDIIVLTLIMHASGGLPSGMGILILIVVIYGSLIMPGKQAILYSSVATIMILGESTYSHLKGSLPNTTYTQAGLMGIALFATSFISLVLAKRLSESEALVEQRDLDLANLEQLNSYIIQNLQSGIIFVDNGNRARLVNDSASYLLGLSKNTTSTSQPLEELAPDLVIQLTKWRLDHNTKPIKFKLKNDSADLMPRFVSLGTKTNTGSLIFLDDAIEIAQKMQQMKLAALGRLTASIAHEIRNPLGAISHAAQLLEESPKLDDEDLRLTQIIHDHSNRMNKIIENILRLSKRTDTHPISMQLSSWLTEFKLDFCASTNTSDKQLHISIYPIDTKVHIDPSHLQQILFNLCQNALLHGKTAEHPHPVVTIKGGTIKSATTPYLDIIDTGPGIDPGVSEKIFEPFFTTAQQGTGLGLYITRELCEYNQARLNYISVPTGGSCFRISFHNINRVAL